MMARIRFPISNLYLFLALLAPCVGRAATATTALSAKAYAQAGLVAQWDAIENAGYGLHGDVATDGWTDLVGGCVLTTNVSAGGSVTTLDNGIVVTKASLRHYATSGTAVDVGNAIGAAKKTIELAGQASYVQNRFWFCVNKYSTDNTANRLILWYEYRGNLLDQYCLYNQCYNQSSYSFGIAANTPFTATTAFSSSTYLNRYANGKLVAAATYNSGTPTATTTTTAGISLHAISYSSTPCSMENTTYRGVRVYKRQLPADEIAWNAMLDRHRFLGEDLDASYNTTTRRYYRGGIEVGAYATTAGTAGGGTVTITCGEKSVGPGETLWMSVDQASATVTYTATQLRDSIFTGWSGDGGLLTAAERLNPTLTFSIGAAPPLVATFVTPKPVEYLQSTGVQYVDCGVHFTYGHKFTLRWSQASYAAKYTEDKGWGTGGLASGNQYDICGGGRNNGNYVRPYMYNANRTFTPTPEPTWAGLVLYDPYEDVCTVQNTTTYTMTHLASGKVYSIAAVATPNTTSYDSGNNINLFSDDSISYRYNGIKRIYRATYETVGGDVVFDFFPVTVDGKPAYYDRISRTFFYNAASGTDFTAGPASTSFRIAVNGDVEFAARATVEAAGGGTVTLSDGTTTVGEGKALWLARGATGNFTYTATPADGYAFSKWTGDTVGLTHSQVTSASLTVAAAGPRALVAVFGKSVSSDIIPTGAYVQDGLIAQWDGIENAGVGVQNTNLTSWIELKQNLETTATALKFDANSAIFNGVDYDGTFVSGSLPAAMTAIKNGTFTADACFNPTVYRQYAGLFHFGVNGGDRIFSLTEDANSFIGAFQYKRNAWVDADCNSRTYAVLGQVNSAAAIADGSKHRLYLAAAQRFVGNAGAVNYSSTVFHFGRYLGNIQQRATMHFHGLRLYDRVLTDDEIRLNAIVDRCRFTTSDDVRYVGTYPSGHFESRIDYVPSAADRGAIECAIDDEAQSADDAVWVAAGKTVTLTPSPKSGYRFYCWQGDTNGTTIASDGVMTFKAFPRSVVALFVKSASSPVTRTLTLASNATKYWDDAANWSPNGVPAADDFVVISGYGTVKVTNSTPLVSSLTIQGNSSSQFAYLNCANWTTKVSADTITVKAYGVFTTSATSYNTSMSNRVWLVCRDLDVQANAQINVDYKGYRNNNGRGWDGVDSPANAAGGAYGGLGADGSGSTLAHCYGSLTNPEDLGSGGYRYTSGDGAYGGGAVKIEAANSVKVNGGIYARGQCTSIWSTGGGSGGSVYISTKTIEGSGTVTAEVIENWGDYGHSNGGGGRIAVHYDPSAQSSKLATCLVNFRANAGAGSCAVHWPYSSMTTAKGFIQPIRWVGGRGYDGTLYFTDNWMLTNTVRLAKGVFLSGVFHSGESFPDPLVLPGPVLFKNSYLLLGMPLDELVIDGDLNCWGTLYMNSGLRLTNTTLHVKGNVTLKGSYFAMTDNRVQIDGDLTQMTSDASQTWIPEARVGRMTIQAGNTNGTSRAYGAEFYVGGTWTLEPYAVVYPYCHATVGAIPYFECLNLDLKKNARFEARETGYGTGHGPGYGSGSAGSSHGGKGSGSSTYVKEPYGSAERPVTPGSGSNAYRGGGAVRIHARNRMDMNGYVNATGNGSYGNWCNGSSGGSIYLSSARFSSTNASSILTVRGGNSTAYNIGAGGGGRIAIWSRAYFATNMQIWVRGGARYDSDAINPADPGTLYWYRNPGTMFLIR